jgi:ADP-glucose pyrophosphorylase
MEYYAFREGLVFELGSSAAAARFLTGVKAKPSIPFGGKLRHEPQ